MKLPVISIALLSLGLGLGCRLQLTAAPVPWFQYEDHDRYDDLRGLIDRTQSDLRASAESELNDGKQRERYRNAQDRLSTFDRHLTKGHFDKGELDKAIGDVQHVLDHNTLQVSARDALLRDAQELRIARERYRR